MTRAAWSLVETAAQLLERDEREVVLGDLLEAGESAWRGLTGVAGLVVRRQAGLWRSWRPWVAAFGLALPGSLLLMGSSLSVSWKVQRLMGTSGVIEDAGFLAILCNALLLIGWAWTSGFVVGSLSQRTVWVSFAACCSPFVLPGEISRDVFVESMPALVPGACNLGSLARLTIDPDKAWVCGGFGGGYYGTDDSDVAWAMGVDLQLGADMAGLVHRGNGTTD
jgi:hypothetical protein